jgi:SepF-like predicted cell division protein (DUF552 family)
MVLDGIKKRFSSALGGGDVKGEDYLEIDLGREEAQNKVLVKLFVLKTYEDITEILNALREGYTIAIIDIRVLRQKDSIELKRAVSKIKKTIDALEGNIAGFGENLVIVTPSFAKISKEVVASKEEKKPHSRFDSY